jgi:NADP-dependent 3-hydroxy acid dehydrogenase YdfG
MEIGFIGLGKMGFPMARRLIEAGHQLTVFDTRKEAADKLTALGAQAASSPKDVADRCETVLASLPSLQASLEVATGAGGVIEGRRIKRFVDLSTVGSQMATRIHGLLAAKNIVPQTELSTAQREVVDLQGRIAAAREQQGRAMAAVSEANSQASEASFVFRQEALNEALRLETALARLRSERRVVLLHYSPIEGTVTGEPKEIYPYLGSSRLEEPLSRYPVDAVFHGHAHHGSAEGRTRNGVPVYNVSLSLLQRTKPEGPPFRILELPVTGGPPD